MGTLSGGGIQTAASGARAAFDQNGLHMYDGGNVLRINLNPLTTRIETFDNSGIARAQMGNLPLNGISPAQWGFRANDASGNPIFDSLGLISVMQILGSVVGPTSTFSTTSTTPVLITGMSVTFSLTRALRVLIQATGACSYNPTGASTAIIDLFLDGTNVGGQGTADTVDMLFPSTAAGAAMGSCVYVKTLAAGSHTCDLRAYQTTGGTSTVNVIQAGLFAFQLGS